LPTNLLPLQARPDTRPAFRPFRKRRPQLDPARGGSGGEGVIGIFSATGEGGLSKVLENYVLISKECAILTKNL